MLPADLDVLAPTAYFVVRQPMLVFRSDRIQKHLVRLQQPEFFCLSSQQAASAFNL